MRCKKLFINFLLLSFIVPITTEGRSYWSSELYFRDIPVDQGLSQSSVYCMHQDDKGFIWIGTKDGLNRYDGYEFLSYKYTQSNPGSLSNNEIICLENDQNKYLWIGTRSGGINRLNFATGDIDRFNTLTYDDLVQDLETDSLNNLWAGTSEGLLLFSADETGERNMIRNVSETARYFNSQGKIFEPGRKNISITVIKEIRKGLLFVGCEEGLFRYDVEKNEFTSISKQTLGVTVFTSVVVDKEGAVWAGSYEGLFKIPAASIGEQEAGLAHFHSGASAADRRLEVDWVEDLAFDHLGNLWVGSRGGGLFKISNDRVVAQYKYSRANKASLPDDLINSLMIDRTGILWIGTESRGLAYSDLYSGGFHVIRPGISPERGLSDNLVTALTGKDSRLWVGTAAAGIDVFSNRNVEISKLNTIPRVYVDNEMFTKEIMALLIDSEDQLWIGSASNRVSVYNRSGEFRSYMVNGFVFSLYEDSNDRIWFGTWGRGLGFIDKKTDQVEDYYGTVANSLGLSSDKVLSIFEDSRGLLWIGTKGGGINVCNKEKVVSRTGEFVAYKNITGDTLSLSYNDVYDILEDQNGDIWLASGSGLNKVLYDESRGLKTSAENGQLSFRSYTERDGLAGGLVLFIEEDSNGRLWLGTNKGISRFEPQSRVFTNYGVNNGLPSGEFHANASYKDRNSGVMYFGGVDGVTVFHPDSMQSNPFPPKPQLTGLRLHNNPVFPDEKVNGRIILDKNITYSDHLTLSHSNNEVTFEFSALHYSNPGDIKYAFRLQGFNESWQETTSENRRATYTNLHEGDYVFEVKATDSSGEWFSETATMLVTINPPLWRTGWAYFIYIALAVFLLFTFRKYSLIGAKQKNNLIIESIQHRKDKELTDAKMRFFTNISHEIRTPLTLIHAPLQEILNRSDLNREVYNTLSIMHRNVKRLLNMVNQLLEFRKIDTGHSEVNPVTFNLLVLCQDTLAAFHSLADQKDIEVGVEAPEEIWITSDEKMISTALYNLLSNALKFTPSGGKVSLQLEYFNDGGSSSERKIIVRVCDSGPGIPEHLLEKVFERFSQVKTGKHSHLGGSGIGLSIVKEFVALNRGEVKAYNREEGGCCFEMILPELAEKVGGAAMEESISDGVEPGNDNVFVVETFSENEHLYDDETAKPGMCIVEDDHELANWLARVFETEFNVAVFYDGKEAFPGILAKMPDIIICDVMLPGMLGTELTETLKKRFETSHIPVILLTAKTGDDSMLEGLKTGADSYITKPFNINILKAQVGSLVKSRMAFKQNFAGKLSLEPSEETITPADEKFLTKLMEVTENKMGDPSFDVSVLVDEMHMSHSIILKKVKSMTGLSLVEFIRSMRIKRAAQIFRQDKLSVSEVSFMVGFSDPKYFSKCFSKQIGKKPTEYIKDHHL
ncbi:two component regulator with propeller domain [Marinilabilia salmonicolor]|jgi:signal transduction histidine kinase/ligand-binding sensor domain-containing protein/AraC-like DNA-binding protein/ActR/RegA family two-component response regulator|uniref:hybrid sensor histidine kinase/response regulator transcription factor n=1 Tax=Marinilabilia salmonicolor TaxID=989 RepID=UPI000D073601|nr:two-component regulator propeller domain-containing protein [Marinilabilia salmonicolor]PRZ02120.1 two component regulator with propeller domain [Marinilabilia salmonicolor]